MNPNDITQQMIDDIRTLYGIDAMAELEKLLVDKVVIAEIMKNRAEKIDTLLNGK